MWRSRRRISRAASPLAAAWLSIVPLVAAELHGRVSFNGLPVPGASVTAGQDGKKFVTTTDDQGTYSLTGLSDGNWSIRVEMLGFAVVEQRVTVASNSPAEDFELKLLPLDQIKAQIQKAPATPIPEPEVTKEAAPADQASEDLTQQAANGFLINGSVANGSASPFALNPAFGNRRIGAKSLYNGGIGITFDNSALDARPFSLTGQSTPKLSYNRLTALLAFGGPLRIPHLLHNGPNVFVGYQWTRNRNATTSSALVPDASEREGLFSQPISDPTTRLPFPGDQIPANRISPQARALLNLYPLPDFTSNAGYNYQIPLISPTHKDALQSRFNKGIGNRDQLYGGLAFANTRTDNPNVFDFLDTTDTLGLNTAVNWSHRFSQHALINLGYQFSRFSMRVTPYFQDRENVSGLAGISGNDQNPLDWGPPSLVFSSGIAQLTDAQSEFNRNQTSAESASMFWNRAGHNFQFGGDFRRQEFNYRSQQNPRGTFTFTGAAAGSDLADFLLGIPDASSIAFGNADKYFRESVYDGYFTDDWRISPEFSLNAGIRWEYGAPITETYNRLVNLDIAPGFGAVAPVLANDPVGSLTGQHYPNSLIRPDKTGFEPRVGFAWRPLSGSSLVVRAGYGVYRDTSVYQTIATQMAQQAPLSKSLSVQNSSADALTLADGFKESAGITPDTFGIDPSFRVGYAQDWELSIQRDLPGSLQMTLTYLGIKGTRGPQEFLPNTFPYGARNPCPACPAGFAYLVSNGNSTRESGQLQLRRRLHNGLTGVVRYTFSKSIDDDATLAGQGFSATMQSNTSGQQGSGSPANMGAVLPAPTASAQPNLAIAQNWLNLSAERSLSSFDQRHLLALQLQYTTGMGLGGGTLLSGWQGALLKEWTFATEVNAGSGLPETPVYLVPVQGTGVTGTIRPDFTGAPLYSAPAGLHLNPAAYVAPPPGEWGTAGRNSIRGPFQFSLNFSLGRTFRVSDRLNLDLRFDSTNALNHVTYTDWNTTVSGRQFGLPVGANAMRSVQTTLRLRF